MADLTTLRTDLVEAAAGLRAAQDGERTQRLLTEDAAIVAAGGVKALGANEDERRRALALALLQSPIYTAALANLRAAELAYDRAAAALESAKDARREAERQTNERLAAALDSRAAPIYTVAV